MRLLFIFTSLIHLSVQKSTPMPSYVAAVVEYEVNANTDTNVQNYVQMIKDAATQNADIIVFPEMTLNRRQSQSIPVPIYGLLKEYPIPALKADVYNEILVAISSAARENAIYVVINIQEVMNCEGAPGEECPEKKIYYFNTNVVFNREGAVIDRYRKINLFGEYTRTPALKPELGDFMTDFGVRFGHFICFDLMFQVPAVQTPQKLNITDVIFPTMWFSEMPYLTAVEIQQGYAAQMNINFLAAGANNVRVGSTGSGIYSGKAGALISLMTGVPTTRLMVARVPKVPGQVTGSYPGPIYDDPSDGDSLLLKSDPSLSAHTSRLLVPGYQSFVLTSGDTICSFKVNMIQTNNTSLKYRAFIHDGFNIYGDIRRIRVASCSIVSCSSEKPKDCPYRFTDDEEKIEFQELNIEISSYPLDFNTSLKCDDVEYFGLSLRNNKFPLDAANATFTKGHDDKRANYSFKINAPQNNLVTFAIWARIYDEDKVFPREVTDNDVSNYMNVENVIFGLEDGNAHL